MAGDDSSATKNRAISFAAGAFFTLSTLVAPDLALAAATREAPANQEAQQYKEIISRTTGKTPATAKKSPVEFSKKSDPLARERKAFDDSKVQFESALAKLNNAKAELGTAKLADEKAQVDLDKAESNAKRTKVDYLAGNDKLSQMKGQDRSEKTIQVQAQKVGT